jgi:hypothetical protein
MRKITLTIGLLASMLLNAKAQEAQPQEPDNYYEKRKLKFEEANFVSNYYYQDGNNSAVTGGVGTEWLTDVALSFDLKFSKFDRKGRQHSFLTDFNIDYYTSASSDNVDPLSLSGPSRRDLHIYPSLSWNVKDDVKKKNYGLTLSYSTEWDYKSRGVSFNYSKGFNNDNTELSLKGGAFFDTWEVILPSELRRSALTRNERFKPRNSYNFSIGVSQVINQRLQAMIVFEPSLQQGLLSTPYHRTYFSNNTHTVEKLPGTRVKFPTSFRLSYFMGDKTILRGFYRFYIDDWGMTAHTVNMEGTYKITPFLSLSPFYRVSLQNAVRYFQPYQQHTPGSEFYTSDFDISGFNSHFLGLGFRTAPPDGVLGMKSLNSLELRYGYYVRNNDSSIYRMLGHSITLQMKIK